MRALLRYTLQDLVKLLAHPVVVVLLELWPVLVLLLSLALFFR